MNVQVGEGTDGEGFVASGVHQIESVPVRTEVGGHARRRVTGGGDVSRLGGDPLAVLVLEFDLLEAFLVAVAGVDVADGPLVLGEETGHAAGALNLVDVSRPVFEFR